MEPTKKFDGFNHNNFHLLMWHLIHMHPSIFSLFLSTHNTTYFFLLCVFIKSLKFMVIFSVQISYEINFFNFSQVFPVFFLLYLFISFYYYFQCVVKQGMRKRIINFIKINPSFVLCFVGAGEWKTETKIKKNP